MKLKCIATLICGLLMQGAMAAHTRPLTCPTINAIKNNINAFEISDMGDFIYKAVIPSAKFSTVHDWLVGIVIDARSTVEARSEISKELSYFLIIDGPKVENDPQDPTRSIWLCEYINFDRSFGMVAVSPPVAFDFPF